jgi:two-component system sensor histidine kinase KdpD
MAIETTAAEGNGDDRADLAAQVDRLLEADRLKNAFMATVSHELRTPLTSIAGFTALLLDAADRLDESQQRDMLARIQRNAEVLSGLIEDVLAFSTLEDQQPPTSFADLPLRAVTMSAITQLGSALDLHVVDVAVPAELRARGDERGFNRSLAGVLKNAAKYAPPGTIIRIDGEQAGDRVRLVVDDQGPGVPADERDLVFERFFRGKGDWVTRTRGTGVGLAVARHLLAGMGGTISVDDTPEGGARFVLDLPAA